MNKIVISTDRTGDSIDDSTIVVSLIEAVAAEEDTSPVELPPLGEEIDADSLCAHVRFLLDCPDDEGSVTFEYHGYDVTVFGDGTFSLA